MKRKEKKEIKKKKKEFERKIIEDLYLPAPYTKLFGIMCNCTNCKKARGEID